MNQDKQLEEQKTERRRLKLEQQRRALELIYDKPASNASPLPPPADRSAVRRWRPKTASGGLQTCDRPRSISSIAHQDISQTTEQSERPTHDVNQHPNPESVQRSLHTTSAKAVDSSAVFGTVLRAPTKEEEYNSRRRHMSLDEACHSSKRERALYGTRPLYAFTSSCGRVAHPSGLRRYSFSTKLGLSSKQLAEEKQNVRPNSASLQQLQRLGRLSSEIEQQRRETKDLVVGIEDVSNSLGIEHKVSCLDLFCYYRVSYFLLCIYSPATFWQTFLATAT
jgi:hypothetical protein